MKTEVDYLMEELERATARIAELEAEHKRVQAIAKGLIEADPADDPEGMTKNWIGLEILSNE